MAYFVAHVLLFFVPGWLLCRRFGIERIGYLLSFSLSYALAALVISVVRTGGSSLPALTGVFVVSLCLLAVSAWRGPGASTTDGRGKARRFNGPVFFGGMCVAVLTIVYLALLGPYLEVPADMLRHLEYSQRAWQDLADGSFRGVPVTEVLNRRGRIWYYIHAWLAHLCGLEIHQTLIAATLANVLILAGGLYCFALYLWRGAFAAGRTTAIAAAMACLLFLIHHGVNVFAYARYYTLAPTFLATLLYLAAIAVIIDGISRDTFPLRNLALCTVITLTAALVHVQEAMFIVLMGAGLLVYRLVATRFGAFPAPRQWWPPSDARPEPPPRTVRGITHARLAAITGVGLIVLYVMARLVLDLNEPRPDNKLLGPFLDGWYILNPTYQFYRVITLWGVLVYGLCLLRWREFLRQPFLLVGMLSPLVTVFNPLFVDLFLRLGNHATLWRMCFMIPVAFSAAWLAAHAWQDLRAGTRVRANAVTLAALVVLLAPLPFDPPPQSFSRFPTLAPIPTDNTVHHWGDLLEFLRDVKGRKLVLTDPVTGYMVAALTRHRSPRFKFFGIRQKQLNFESYDTNPLAQYKGALLVVNLRDGGTSLNGRRAHHWPENVLRVSDHYSDRLLDHVKSHPERFVPMWSADRIDVYKIKGRGTQGSRS